MSGLTMVDELEAEKGREFCRPAWIYALSGCAGPITAARIAAVRINAVRIAAAGVVIASHPASIHTHPRMDDGDIGSSEWTAQEQSNTLHPDHEEETEAAAKLIQRQKLLKLSLLLSFYYTLGC